MVHMQIPLKCQHLPVFPICQFIRHRKPAFIQSLQAISCKSVLIISYINSKKKNCIIRKGPWCPYMDIWRRFLNMRFSLLYSLNQPASAAPPAKQSVRSRSKSWRSWLILLNGWVRSILFLYKKGLSWIRSRSLQTKSLRD